MAVVHSTLWDSVKELVLEQYKSSPKFRALIQSVVEECAQPLEDSAADAQDFFDIDRANGKWLDVIGKILNVERNPGESDDSFRDRLKIVAYSRSAGTPDNVISTAAMISGAQQPQFMDEADATFFIYTGPTIVNETFLCAEDDSRILAEDGRPIVAEAPVVSGGGSQLTRDQVKKISPAGVLGLPGAAIQFADGSFLADAEGRLILAVADENIQNS